VTGKKPREAKRRATAALKRERSGRARKHYMIQKRRAIGCYLYPVLFIGYCLQQAMSMMTFSLDEDGYNP
jgi:hypothetical protein